MIYSEKIEDSAGFKQDYADGIENLLMAKEAECRAGREKYISGISADKDSYRQDFINMLGWPLTEYRGDTVPDVISEKLSSEEGYEILRLQIEILGGLRLTGLLFKYNDGESRPLVVVQHGGSGTPELISGINGSTANYNNMLRRVFDRGVNVFAPQLLLWASDKYGVAIDRQRVDSRMKRLGGSVTALEVYGIRRALDYFTTQPYVKNIGMVGMSYGGFYTLMTTAADERIRAALSCSYFCDGSVFNQPDLCHWGEMLRFGQAETACLVHPRRLFVQMGDSDELFDYKKSTAEFERAVKLSGSEDWIKFAVYGGNHEFCKDDAFIDELAEILKR